MPELPELEGLARTLDASLPGREIVGVETRSPSLVKTYQPAIERLVGDAFDGVRRRGKWLLLGTRSGRTLAVHLMTGGRLRRTDGRPAVARADGLVVRFADGDLRVAEIGSKKRSAVHLVDGDGAEVVGYLGPDPLDRSFDANVLRAALARQPRQLKSALTDQRVIAGIGNAWADEILHRARLSPLLQTPKLTTDGVVGLHDAMQACIEEGIAYGQRENYLEKLKADGRAYLRVHNRTGEPCPVCQARLAAIHFGDRATTYCPACQSDGRVYADRRLSRLLR